MASRSKGFFVWSDMHIKNRIFLLRSDEIFGKFAENNVVLSELDFSNLYETYNNGQVWGELRHRF